MAYAKSAEGTLQSHEFGCNFLFVLGAISQDPNLLRRLPRAIED